MTKRTGTFTVGGLVLSVVLGVFVGVSGFTFEAAKGLSYLSNDPTSCVNCHIMREQYESWQHSSHHAVATCNDCHVPQDFFGKYFTKAENGFRHSWVSRSRISTSRSSCIRVRRRSFRTTACAVTADL